MKKKKTRVRVAQIFLVALFLLLPFASAYAAGEEEPTALNMQNSAIDPITSTAPQTGSADDEAGMEPALLAAGDVAINATNFPDPVFRQYVEDKLDPNHDWVLTQAECEAVTSINVAQSMLTGTIYSLEGIGFFPNITFLKCDGNAITSLDMSGNPNLETLICENNQISVLNLTGNPELQHLECYNDPLTELDLSGNPKLEELIFGGGKLTSIDFSHNPNLSMVTYLSGAIVDMDLSTAPNIRSFICVGTNMSSINLSENPNLNYLTLTEDQFTNIDLSHNPNLNVLELDANKLVTIDLTANPKLTNIDLSKNNLISLHMGTNTSANVADQNPYTILLSQGETSYDLTRLDPDFDGAAVSNLQNATLNGTTLENLTVGVPVTYNYTSNGVVLQATLDVQEGNVWTVPLSIENWTYGQTPSTPTAQAKYGTVHFLYGQNGVFTENVPQTAGIWTVKAVVDGTQDYSGLETTAEFEIYKATPNYTVPAPLYGTYGDTLHDILLKNGFSWMNETQSVGNAGEHTFEAVYTPEDTVDYITVEHIPLEVTILPKDGTGFPISAIQNAQDAQNIVIQDGTITLVLGRDYTVTQRQDGNTMIVTIQYIGNYTGTVQRSYSLAAAGNSDNPKTDDPRDILFYGIAAGGALLAIGTVVKRRAKTN